MNSPIEMKKKLKITSWNVEWLDKLIIDPINDKKKKRLNAIAEEIQKIDPDILCILEGAKGEENIDKFCNEYLSDKYLAIKANDNDYKQQGRQWIWFLVKTETKNQFSLLPTSIWDEFAGASWQVNYWGNFASTKHKHYRHPQVLYFKWKNTRIELIGLHTKSKFVMGGENAWKSGGEKKQIFIEKAIKARIKMTTEVANVRAYIDKKFEQVPDPAIFVMGDLNDGPGKEFFEKQYLFFDLLSNLQGDVFSARKFLNHALFDFDDNLRWSCFFKDFIDPDRNPKILLDHILFTQGLVNASLPVKVESKSGYIEHEIHDLIVAAYPKYAKSSDHKPISIIIKESEIA